MSNFALSDLIQNHTIQNGWSEFLSWYGYRTGYLHIQSIFNTAINFELFRPFDDETVEIVECSVNFDLPPIQEVQDKFKKVIEYARKYDEIVELLTTRKNLSEILSEFDDVVMCLV